MRDLILSEGGHKISADDFVHLQAGYKEAFKAIIDGFLGLDTVGQLGPYDFLTNPSAVNESTKSYYYIVSGCHISYPAQFNTTISPGWIFYNDGNMPDDNSRIPGELLYFPGVKYSQQEPGYGLTLQCKIKRVLLDSWPVLNPITSSPTLPLESPTNQLYKAASKDGASEVRYASGDTNDVHVINYLEITAKTSSGPNPPVDPGYFKLPGIDINDGTRPTLYNVIRKVKVLNSVTSDNSLKFGGQLPAYYAKQADLTTITTNIINGTTPVAQSDNSDKVDGIHAISFVRKDESNVMDQDLGNQMSNTIATRVIRDINTNINGNYRAFSVDVSVVLKGGLYSTFLLNIPQLNILANHYFIFRVVGIACAHSINSSNQIPETDEYRNIDVTWEGNTSQLATIPTGQPSTQGTYVDLLSGSPHNTWRLALENPTGLFYIRCDDTNNYPYSVLVFTGTIHVIQRAGNS